MKFKFFKYSPILSRISKFKVINVTLSHVVSSSVLASSVNCCYSLCCSWRIQIFISPVVGYGKIIKILCSSNIFILFARLLELQTSMLWVWLARTRLPAIQIIMKMHSTASNSPVRVRFAPSPTGKLVQHGQSFFKGSVSRDARGVKSGINREVFL
jgi:hypothetical protein